MEVYNISFLKLKITGALLYLLIYNNALFAFNTDCSKIIYTASKIKNYAERSLESDLLSTCKYYVFNSSQLYKQITAINLDCNCINLEGNKLHYFFEKAEISTTTNYCQQFVKKSLKELNLIVDNIISCKLPKN